MHDAAVALPRRRGTEFSVGTAPQSLDLHLIRRDGGTQPRAGLDPATVAEYMAAMEAGDMFPPVEVYYDGTSYWLVDGFHRVRATEQRGLTTISAMVHQGTQADAQWYSFGVNGKHGLRRSNADKRRAVQSALKHPNAVGKSDREIARHVGVDHKTVGAIRAELAAGGEIPHLDERTGADGKVYDTRGIRQANEARAQRWNEVTAPQLTETHDAAQSDLTTDDLTRLVAAGWTWQSARQTPDGQWHHLVSRGTDQRRMLRHRLDQIAPPNPLPDPPDGWRWAMTSLREHVLVAPDGWQTRAYQKPERALAEANRRILSQPQRKQADPLPDFEQQRRRAVSLGFDDLQVVREAEQTQFMLLRNSKPYATASWRLTLETLDRFDAMAQRRAEAAAAPELPGDLQAAGYEWEWVTPTVAVITHPRLKWRADAPTPEGAIALAQAHDQAQRQPAPANEPQPIHAATAILVQWHDAQRLAALSPDERADLLRATKETARAALALLTALQQPKEG